MPLSCSNLTCRCVTIMWFMGDRHIQLLWNYCRKKSCLSWPSLPPVRVIWSIYILHFSYFPIIMPWWRCVSTARCMYVWNICVIPRLHELQTLHYFVIMCMYLLERLFRPRLLPYTMQLCFLHFFPFEIKITCLLFHDFVYFQVQQHVVF